MLLLDPPGDLADCEDDELCSCLTEDSEKKCKCEDNSKYAVCMKPASDTGTLSWLSLQFDKVCYCYV